MNDKMIEEMAMIMCGNDCEECARESAEFHRQTIEEARNSICLIKNCAKALYNAGYRKISDNDVVISKEEWKRIKSSLYYSKEELEKKLDKARKETAREILERGKYCMPSGLREWIIERYGVGLGEEDDE